MNPILSSLTPSEREALSTCGILNDAQLAKVNVDALLQDLQMAKEAFPEADFSISEAKLRGICAKASDTQPLPIAEQDIPQGKGGQTDETAEESETEVGQEDDIPRALPELSLRRHQHRNARSRNYLNHTAAPGVESSVHCSRPITTYLSALSMVAFYTGLLTLFLIPFLIFTGKLEGEDSLPVAATGGLLLVPYILIGAWCHCSVCKMNMFRLAPYNLNRHAHTMPFLGLTTLVTALHIIFRLWYRCPACGTAIRLFRSRHSHRRH